MPRQAALVDPGFLFLMCALSGAVLAVWFGMREVGWARPMKRSRVLDVAPIVSGTWIDALGHSLDVSCCASSLWVWRPSKSAPIGSVLVLLDVGSGRTLRVGAAVKYARDAIYGDRFTDCADVTVSPDMFDRLVRMAMPEPAVASRDPFRQPPAERLIHADDEDAPLSDFRVALACSEHAPEDAVLSIGMTAITFQSKSELATRPLAEVRVTRGHFRGELCVRPTLLVEGIRTEPICLCGPNEAEAAVALTPAPHYSVGPQDWARLVRALDGHM